MPEFKLPTVKLRGFREMTTDDIKNVISDVPRPDVKLADIADAAVAATEAAARAAADAAAAAQSAAQQAVERTRPKRRSRRPMLVLGMMVATIGLIALANAEWIRARLSEIGQRARERMEADQVSDSLDRLGSDEEAYTGAAGIPIQPDPFAETLPPAAPTEMTPQTSAYETTSGEAHAEGAPTEESRAGL